MGGREEGAQSQPVASDGPKLALAIAMSPRSRPLRLALLSAVLVALVLTIPITLTPGVRSRLTTALGERFESDVQLESLRISVLPRLRVSGDRVVLRHKGRSDVPPLVSIGSFSAEASLFGLVGGVMGQPLRLSRVHLDTLEINVPPGGLGLDDGENEDDNARAASGDSALAVEPPQPIERVDNGSAPPSPIVVDDLLSERAVLRILPRETGKDPRVFEIAHLSMQDTGSNEPWAFEATLTNPTPPGEIATHGTFGPWNAERPSATPLDAEYEFDGADLGVFKGIRGILHSTGAFHGVLERIEVTGRTEVPDFALDEVGHPVPLTTEFHAIVDGTNGNTWLQPVDARLLDSPILAEGGVVEGPGEEGRTITLDVVMEDARIEDVLRLAVKSPTPPMTGGLTLRTTFVLPPGDAVAMDKLQLDGSFEIARARFAGGGVQAKLEDLSQKARGELEETSDRVVSDFRGRFVMKDGVIRFSTITFTMPGARMDLGGSYTLRSEALDFRGTVRMDAKLSQMTTGAKSFLLKLVDPLVRRKDVTVIPVTIRGTAAKPDFGVDLRRTLARD